MDMGWSCGCLTALAISFISRLWLRVLHLALNLSTYSWSSHWFPHFWPTNIMRKIMDAQHLHQPLILFHRFIAQASSKCPLDTIYINNHHVHHPWLRHQQWPIHLLTPSPEAMPIPTSSRLKVAWGITPSQALPFTLPLPSLAILPFAISLILLRLAIWVLPP